MKKIISTILLSIFWLGESGCKDDDSPVTPSNLIITPVISTTGTGLVSFTATADRATTFDFYFGESNDTPFKSSAGQASHAYGKSGTYDVKVVAYSKDNLSIDKTISITVLVGVPPIPTTGYSTPEKYTGMNLVWQDEFSGSQLNLTDWKFETGGSGWGNNELEYYQEKNTAVYDGYLIITAKKESAGGKDYTSSRIKTQGLREFQYGRIDIRALLPEGQGIWPALWMLGYNIDAVSWPGCGEIDIMEMIGGGTGRDNTVYGTAHWDNAGSYASYGGNRALTTGKVFADEFHVFSIVWTAASITWYLDDVQFHVIDITPAGLSEFKNKFFLIFNVAVGGNWPGSPNASTIFPQRMVVDYVRIFQPQ